MWLLLFEFRYHPDVLLDFGLAFLLFFLLVIALHGLAQIGIFILKRLGKQ